MLVKNNIIMKRGDDEAAQIRYVSITKNSQGLEEIEVQGKFLITWIGKRIIKKQIITNDTTQNILYRIVRENVTNPADTARKIPDVSIATDDEDTGKRRDRLHFGAVHKRTACGRNGGKGGEAGNTNADGRANRRARLSRLRRARPYGGQYRGNAPCIFSQEFDNIVEQEYTNSVENLKTTAFVGGEEKEGVASKVAEVGGSAAGLAREEVFINATDIVQEYEDDDGEQVTLTDAEYLALLSARGAEELEQYAETLSFGSKINTFANLIYRTDYDLGDRVTCVNKRWGIRIDVRITEIAETYQNNVEEIDITFGESLPALFDADTADHKIKGCKYGKNRVF